MEPIKYQLGDTFRPTRQYLEVNFNYAEPYSLINVDTILTITGFSYGQDGDKVIIIFQNKEKKTESFTCTPYEVTNSFFLIGNEYRRRCEQRGVEVE